MNRIILIGNGFDLTHGLKTGYPDFIDDFWNKKAKSFEEAYNNGNLNFLNRGNRPRSVYEDKDISIAPFFYNPVFNMKREPSKSGYDQLLYLVSSIPRIDASLITKINFTNTFLEQITKNKNLFRWVDIEEEYYTALNSCLTGKRNGGIKQLNIEFQGVQKYLEEYLITQTTTVISDSIKQKIYQPFSLVAGSEQNILFLSFNYTSTEKLYIQYPDKDKIIHIHGQLDNPLNPIIFGYGDEIDEKYKAIQQINDNDYLENIKTMKYLLTRNYKELMNFINPSKYEVFIMGHSCGISDRTLLNKLFEHKNCISIKFFYHKRSDGTDNYIDIIKNISRNFNSNSLMRDIVVNKFDSEPLI